MSNRIVDTSRENVHINLPGTYRLKLYIRNYLNITINEKFNVTLCRQQFKISLFVQLILWLFSVPPLELMGISNRSVLNLK